MEQREQGSNVIDLADQESRWGTNFSKGIQIWRDGCIIEADVRSRVDCCLIG